MLLLLRRAHWLVAVLACAALTAVAWPVGPARAGTASTTRVLLVGNSYTRFNVMPRMLHLLARGTGVELPTESITHAGYTLRAHWRVGETRRRVRSGRYSHVVLQDHSLRPIDRPAEFEDYAERFTRAVHDAGGQPILYETWPRHPDAPLYRERQDVQSPPQMAARVGEAYRRLATAQDAQLAPVGSAFLTALTSEPDLVLYKSDGAHPSFAGSYLAACILFGTITGLDPRDSSYAPWEMHAEQAERVRLLAAEVLAVERQRGRDLSSASVAMAPAQQQEHEHAPSDVPLPGAVSGASHQPAAAP